MPLLPLLPEIKNVTMEWLLLDQDKMKDELNRCRWSGFSSLTTISSQEGESKDHRTIVEIEDYKTSQSHLVTSFLTSIFDQIYSRVRNLR